MNKKHFRISQEAERYFRIFLVLVFAMVFYSGPYELLQLCGIKEVEGILETTGVVVTDRRLETPKPRLIKVVVNGEKYYISHIHIEKEINQATKEIAGYIGEPISLKYIHNPLSLSLYHNGNIVVGLESTDGQLFADEDMQAVWKRDAIETTVIGSLFFAFDVLLYSIATGRIRKND